MDNEYPHVSKKFRGQIFFADEESKKRNFCGADGISNTVHPPFHFELRIGDPNVRKKILKKLSDMENVGTHASMKFCGQTNSVEEELKK